MKIKFLIIMLILIAGIFDNLVACRVHLTKRQYQETKAEIEELVTYNINGYDSKVLIRGVKRDNPILLFIHGLGYSDMMFTRCYDQKLLDDFTIVRYDQRGVGKSDSKVIEDSSLTIENYISDLLCLTDSIQIRFPDAKIYLLGHSWGTVLGLEACYRSPEKYACYISMAQIVNQKKADKISYDYALKKAKDEKLSDCIKILKGLNRETYNQNHDSLLMQRGCLKMVGGTYGSPEAIDDMKNCALRSPEHGLFELLFTPGKAKKVERLIFPSMLEVNFFETISRIEVPVFFFGGRHDYLVPSVLSHQYFETVHAPVKEFLWFEKSGHLPLYEENDKFTTELKRIKSQLNASID